MLLYVLIAKIECYLTYGGMYLQKILIDRCPYYAQLVWHCEHIKYVKNICLIENIIFLLK